MLGAPDMAFESSLVYCKYMIKILKMIRCFNPPQSSMGSMDIFIGLRSETSIKWLYMSYYWCRN